jgi:hypothetical protein
MERKNPWEEAPYIWPTKAAFFNWMRGNLRRALWEKYPLKIEFKNSVCKPPPEGYTGRAKSGAPCALTGEWVGKSAAEIDHLIGHVSLQSWEDVLPFVQHLCTSKDNMAYVSREAHKVKSHAERKGIPFEEALLEKQVIAIEKLKTAGVIAWLTARGIHPAKNAKERRVQIESEIRKSQNE